jgi:MFS family permease
MTHPMTNTPSPAKPFFGWRVVTGAFVLASFGWGLGFYGVSIYLHEVKVSRGWSIALVSSAVTLHYISGALVVANLPKLYQKFGLPSVTRIGAISVALGLMGWANATQPWHLFLATLLTGCGWVTMGAAAINTIISPWFVSGRPKALSTAYNGASVGGIIFIPLWVFMIANLTFPWAATIIGITTVATVWWLTSNIFNHSPTSLGQWPDGIESVSTPTSEAVAPTLPGRLLWKDGRFLTLAIGMALGLFAQIGLLAHLFSIIVPALGKEWAGIVMGMATASAILGRTSFGWLLPQGADRRLAAVLSYGIQIMGALALILSNTQSVPLILLGIMLFGFGIGNATSLPPLIAQVEFAKQDTPRVVALIVATAQATYAFAPAIFGLVRDYSGNDLSWPIFAVAITVKLLAISSFLIGRRLNRGS